MGSYNITITKLFFDQYDNKTFDDIVRNLLDKKVDGVLIATLFTDSVIRLSRELDRFEIPYIYVDSNIEGQHQLAYFGTESYDAGVIAARLLTDRISPASDILMARIIHSGKNDSNQGRNRREGFCRYLKEMRFTGSLHEVELKINDSVYNFTKLDEIFESNPNIEGAVIFNSTCYILGNYLKARAMQSVKILSPLLLITALAVKFSSPGPVLFKQQRLGLHGKVFTIYKFRSMTDGAEHTGSGVYSGKGDARVTKVGKLIRATSIDELPQFINIIVGDMAIVGPRPPLTYHPWPVEQYTEEQFHMFDVRPGITGWAQVHGRKGVEWHERIKMNVWYTQHVSLALDIKILFMTVFKVLRNEDNVNTGATV